MKKSNTDTCCLTLPLKLEKWQEDRLAKRFEIARQIYNTLVRAEFKKLNELEQTALPNGLRSHGKSTTPWFTQN